MSRSVRLRPILLLTTVLLSAAVSFAQDTSSQTTRKARLEKEIAILDRQLKENASRNSNALNALNLIQQKMELRKGLIAESDREIRAIDTQLRSGQSRIDSLQTRLDTLTFYYKRLVRGAYKNRDARLWYMYILASDDLAQGYRRYSFLKNLSAQMNIQGRKIKDSKEELEQEKARLVEMRNEARTLRSSRVNEINSLQKEEADSKKTISQLQKEKTKYQNQLNAKRKEVEALNREIQRIIAEAMGQSSSSGSKKASSKKPAASIDYTLAKEFASNKGKLPWPAVGPVVETFGVHYHPVYKQLKLPNSDGISIAVADGEQIKAVFDGVVKNVIVQPGYNKCVLVQHGDYFTFYCKLGTVSVKAGDKVKTGQAIGVVEPIGGVTQLHFQLWSSKGPQNPMPWLRPR